MSEPEKTTKVVQTYDQPIEIALTRGAKGQYRWSINVKAESPLAALRQVQDIDSELRHRFGEASEPDWGSKVAGSKPAEDPHQRMEKTIENAKRASEKGLQLVK